MSAIVGVYCLLQQTSV